MPHLTEKIWQLMPVKKEEKAIMKSKFPEYNEKFDFEEDSKAMEMVFDAIRSIRNIRQSFNISPSVKVNVKIQGEIELYKKVTNYLKRLARVEEIEFIDDNHTSDKQSASAVVQNSKIIVPLKGLIDIEQEISRQNKKLDKLNQEKNSLQNRINNEKFVNSAPAEVVQKTKDRIQELEAEGQIIKNLIDNLS